MTTSSARLTGCAKNSKPISPRLHFPKNARLGIFCSCYYKTMNKHRKTTVISIILICIIAILGGLGIWLHKTYSKNLIYETTYSFAFGSRRVKIYDNGEVYDDTEVEEPNHKENFTYLKTLTAEQTQALQDKKASGASEEELSDYVIQLVYGVKEFSNTGKY